MLRPVSEPVLYHNPRCSKSRAALALLEVRGVGFRVVEYLKSPLDRSALDVLRQRLGAAPAEWIRRGESAFADAGLGPDSSDDELLDAIAAHPILLERPIFESGDRAVVGRPPERVLELL
jgi:arsenate reductase